MSNVVLANTKVPAYLANRVGKPSVLGQAISGGLGSGEGVPRISIKGGRFRLVEDGNEVLLDTTSIDVVIVGANPHLSKTWYATAWTPDAEPTSPDCFSLNGVSPDPGATSPQNDLCASCPQNAWGSKVSPQGKKIKACADQKRLAVVSADDPSGTVYLLQVTPAALRDLNAYQKELSVRGIAPEIVRTRVYFDTDASFPKLMFRFGGFLEEDAIHVVDKLLCSPHVREITGEETTSSQNMQVVEPEFEPEVPKKPKPAAIAAPKKVDAAPVKHGFGAPKKVDAAPVKHGFGAPKKAAPVEASNSLADEIAALVNEVEADDA